MLYYTYNLITNPAPPVHTNGENNMLKLNDAIRNVKLAKKETDQKMEKRNESGNYGTIILSITSTKRTVKPVKENLKGDHIHRQVAGMFRKNCGIFA